MSGNLKCCICSKTAYPLESVNAIEKTYHKTCFKCSICQMTLNLKNYKGLDGKIYCFTHVPVARSSVSGDGVAVTSALKAPKAVAEGLAQVHKGDHSRASAHGSAVGAAVSADTQISPSDQSTGAEAEQEEVYE